MGRLVAPYGVRGWIKVEPYSQQREGLLAHPAWWIEERGAWVERAVVQARMHGQTIVAQLAGIATRDDALALRGALIGVPKQALPPLAEGELYVADLVGLDVVNREGTALGRVIEVRDNGVQPLLRLAGERERLVPFVPAIVDEVDVEARRIVADWQPDW